MVQSRRYTTALILVPLLPPAVGEYWKTGSVIGIRSLPPLVGDRRGRLLYYSRDYCWRGWRGETASRSSETRSRGLDRIRYAAQRLRIGYGDANSSSKCRERGNRQRYLVNCDSRGVRWRCDINRLSISDRPRRLIPEPTSQLLFQHPTNTSTPSTSVQSSLSTCRNSRRIPPPHATTHPPPKHTVATIRYPLPHH